MRLSLPRSRWSWRWGAFACGVAALACLPAAVAALPVGSGSLPPARLLARVLASTDAPYQGYAESFAGLGLPDLPRAGRVVALLGGTTRMRVWAASSRDWRVDELSAVGERDLYHHLWGTELWDSGQRRVTVTRGQPTVRLLRPADLLPPELGRRVAAAAGPGEVLVSRTVKDLVAGSGIEFTERGDHDLKGVGRWGLHAVTA
jgi:class 3 adenylate cyclase